MRRKGINSVMIGATMFLLLFSLFLIYGERVPQEIMGPILAWMVPFGLVVVFLYAKSIYRELRTRKTKSDESNSPTT